MNLRRRRPNAKTTVRWRSRKIYRCVHPGAICSNNVNTSAFHFFIRTWPFALSTFVPSLGSVSAASRRWCKKTYG